MQVNLSEIPSSRFTDATVKKMLDFVQKAQRDYKFIQLATKIIDSCPAKDKMCEGKTIFYFVKKTIKFVNDPIDVELVRDPWVILQERKADCDELSLLIAALAASVGIPYKFATIAADLVRPDEFSHVYTMMYIQGKWHGADASVPKSYFGWEPERYYKIKYWS